MINKILKFFSKTKSSQDEDEAVVARIEETFIHICELFPDKDTHFHLIETYLQVLIGS